MNIRTKVKKRTRLVFLIAVMLFGLVVFAVAYPIATASARVSDETGGDALAGY